MKKLFKYFTLIAFSLITIKNYASDLKFKSVVALTANKNQSNTIMSVSYTHLTLPTTSRV